MPPLREMFSDIERADAVQSETSISVVINLSLLTFYVHHGIQSPLRLMASKARIICLGYHPSTNYFEKKGYHTNSQRQYASILN